MATAKNPPMTFAKGLKSFMGYLEGTEKSAHTMKNYRLDLLSFQAFVEGQSGAARLERLSIEDLDRFHDHLKTQGLKTNTRRRKLLTVRRFLTFLVNRGKLPDELGRKVPTPHKIERIPMTLSSDALLARIRALPSETALDERNRALLWTLAEAGCQVSEVAELRFGNWDPKLRADGKARLRIGGKSPREIPVSRELVEAVEHLRGRAITPSRGRQTADWVFPGFNRFGALGGAISPRGVELLVKHFGPRLGSPELTPRTFRHSAVVKWFREGCSREEIRERLGLKTAYAFRSYEPLFSESRAKPAQT